MVCPCGAALMNGLSAPTSEGDLFEVDTSLRPSAMPGRWSPNSVPLSIIKAHQAWTWEHMALTRGRVLAADAVLARESGGGDKMC